MKARTNPQSFILLWKLTDRPGGVRQSESEAEGTRGHKENERKTRVLKLAYSSEADDDEAESKAARIHAPYVSQFCSLNHHWVYCCAAALCVCVRNRETERALILRAAPF